jgi:tetratricopeptide (TPR) repeat protein
VDQGVIATANELYCGRHFPGVVAMCSDALEDEPECLELLVIRARAHMALRRELEAQADLRDIIRLDPKCGVAYRLLGELAARRAENESAAIFFREAIRLDSSDQEAREWLAMVTTLRPAAAANKLPAPAAVAGHLPTARSFARGTRPPDDIDQTPTYPFTRGSTNDPAAWRNPNPVPPSRGSIPELPGFGDYLVTEGILTRERLRAAQAYQRSMRVQLSTAIVTLGLASPQRIEWAAVAHQTSLARRAK